MTDPLHIQFSQEWRHTYGLRCLGIPNIKHFAEVTTIEGVNTCKSSFLPPSPPHSSSPQFVLSLLVLSLFFLLTIVWSKIQREKDKVVFKADQEEEYEDQRGNVFNKKTYEDLRRQGLL